DCVVRIPAEALEKKHAEEIYEGLKQQAIDPSLLQIGKHTTDRTESFTAKITPIPAYGTKRLELEYHENIPVENFKSFFSIALQPDAFLTQSAAHFSIHFELRSEHPIARFKTLNKIYPLKIEQQTPNLIRAAFQAQNLDLSEDFAVQYELQPVGDRLHILTHRDPNSGQPDPTETSPRPSAREPGFFEVQAVLGQQNASSSRQKEQPR